MALIQNLDNIVFLFLYEHLKLGGIEKTLIDQFQAYSKRNVRIVWLRYGNSEDIYEPWREIVETCKVEIVQVDINAREWIKKENLFFKPQERVYAVAYEPLDFARLEELSCMYSNEINCFYQVPHFEGRVNYLEEFYFRNRKKKFVTRRLRNIYLKWYENGSLTFFSYKHIEEMNKRYQVPCLERNDLIFKTPVEPPTFNYELAKERAKRQEFRIITCGRFEFPHKGYMFGLIDAYCKLKDSYPQLKLDIVGYGIHEEKIKEYVLKLKSEYAKDISFLGAVAPSRLIEYFNYSHVNVSVAYSLLDGARTGIVSLPARHYTYDCEVYGYLSKKFGNYLDSRKGEPVEKYIEHLINMEEEEYIKLCKYSYDYAIDNYEYDPLWLFMQENKQKNYHDIQEICFLNRIRKHHKVKLHIRKIVLEGLKKVGLYKVLKNVKYNLLENRR